MSLLHAQEVAFLEKEKTQSELVNACNMSIIKVLPLFAIWRKAGYTFLTSVTPESEFVVAPTRQGNRKEELE